MAFYAGDEYADDECTSGLLAWCEAFYLYDDEAEVLDDDEGADKALRT